jgi:hypothetical protein
MKNYIETEPNERASVDLTVNRRSLGFTPIVETTRCSTGFGSRKISAPHMTQSIALNRQPSAGKGYMNKYLTMKKMDSSFYS